MTGLGSVPLACEGFVIRPYAESDRESLARHADDHAVWRNLTDRFPRPYTLEAADQWIASQRAAEGEGELTNYGIEIDGELGGGIGIQPFEDLQRLGAEIGYWLGRSFWGHGIATRALRRFTERVFEGSDLVRLQANVLEWNPASARVLEKAGYTREAVLRRAMVKDGEIIDALLYAKLREP